MKYIITISKKTMTKEKLKKLLELILETYNKDKEMSEKFDDFVQAFGDGHSILEYSAITPVVESLGVIFGEVFKQEIEWILWDKSKDNPYITLEDGTKYNGTDIDDMTEFLYTHILEDNQKK